MGVDKEELQSLSQEPHSVGEDFELGGGLWRSRPRSKPLLHLLGGGCNWGCKKGPLGRGPVVSDNKSMHIRIAKPLAGACCDGLLPVRGERVVAEYGIHGVIICQADAGCLWAQ